MPLTTGFVRPIPLNLYSTAVHGLPNVVPKLPPNHMVLRLTVTDTNDAILLIDQISTNPHVVNDMRRHRSIESGSPSVSRSDVSEIPGNGAPGLSPYDDHYSSF